ncbi:hypothetical protein SAMN05421740_1027 [Parapedobacter koreensis]|uniref:Uncharacterized protein n=2 Tax=Parapedobacter koreensis TaxID=332977 RepID=A0A1H7HUV0_9SPHI|nr:hypothetical protein SAMN05421740_1027 [Parapedobacter koreensis]
MRNSLQLSVGTGSGTMLSIIGQLGMYDVMNTVALAAIGAVVSFVVTLLLQRWLRSK